MYKGKKIAVIIPSFNVEGHIVQTIHGIPEYVDEIIVVDDCSTDNTPRVLQQIIDPRLNILKTLTNLGVGGAMKRGFKKALETKSDIIVKIDGDGQMDSSLLPLFIEPILIFHVDYTKGNRLLHRRHHRKMPPVRLWGNVILSFLNKMASGHWYIFDAQNGYVAILASTLADLDFDRIDDSYFFENSMLVQLNCLDALVLDIPMDSVYGNEVSHLRIQQTLWQFPRKLIASFCYRIWYRHIWYDFTPVGLLLISGFSLLSFGAVFSVYHWIRAILGETYASAGTVMMGGLFIILGFQLFLHGLLLDISWARRLSTLDGANIRNWMREWQSNRSLYAVFHEE